MMKKIITFSVVLIILCFLFWNIYINWPEIINFPWKFSFKKLLLVLVTLLPIYFLTSFSWYLIMHTLNKKISFVQSFKIWVFSNIGRFIPGVIWQYAGRVYLSSKIGISKSITLSGIALESIMVILVGSFMISIFLLFLPNQLQLNQYKNLFNVVAIISLVSVFSGFFFLNNKSFTIWLINFFQKITKRNLTIKSIKINKKYFPFILFNYFLQFTMGGLVLFFLSEFAIDIALDKSLPFIIIYTTSWILGYLTIFAPSGLGIQELTMAGLLSFYMPFPIASIIAILFRISLLISEMLALLFGILILKINNK